MNDNKDTKNSALALIALVNANEAADLITDAELRLGEEHQPEIALLIQAEELLRLAMQIISKFGNNDDGYDTIKFHEWLNENDEVNPEHQKP